MGDSFRKLENPWKEIRKKRIIFFSFILTFIPLVAISSFAGLSDGIITGLFALWFFAGALPISINYVSSKCPNCSNSFFYKGYANVFRTKCLWCGIKIGDELKDK